MSPLLKSLLLAAAGTGVAALVLRAIRRRPPAPRSDRGLAAIEVDADRLPEAERQRLLDELAAQL